MNQCAICKGKLDRIDLSVAMYEGQIVRHSKVWAGQLVCSTCFQVVVMDDLNRILALGFELGWRLEYTMWFFDIALEGKVVSKTEHQNYYLVKLERVKRLVRVLSPNVSLGQTIKVCSDDGYLIHSVA